MNKYATITVIGKDKTGVVARITGFLFHQKANIEALEEQVTRGQFSMTVQTSWKDEELDRAGISKGLEALARELEMEIKTRYTTPNRRQRMAIMVTREPHCFRKLLDAIEGGRLKKADPALVLSNRRDLESMARKAGLPFVHVPWDERLEAERQAVRILDEYEIDFVVLARFMKILSPNFVWRFKNKIINIHPSLLPSFPGPQAYRQAYEQGVKIIGVSSHFVTMNLDEGPIIAQDCFPVRPGMTLKQIVAAGQKLEAATLLKAVRLYLDKRLDVHWGIVKEV
ncbi:MAG TPA: formyltetrahydrofolate deformylase [Candidatus Dormibacteraeota bacterium]|nr:formyltetrahydrofolate deformylase [Candidatus Dormibacteraeota bacterium]